MTTPEEQLLLKREQSELFQMIVSTMQTVEKESGKDVPGTLKKGTVQHVLRMQFNIPDDVSSVVIDSIIWVAKHKKEISAFVKKTCHSCCN